MLMKRILLIVLTLWVLQPLSAADLRVIQLLNFSTYYDFDSNGSPLAEQQQIIAQPIYLNGFYYIDARLQNMLDEAWMVRAAAKGKGVFSLNDYSADLRLAYVENRKPLGKHWLFNLGLIRSPFMLPVQRLLGGSVAYSFDEEGRAIIGVVGGMIPTEPVGYRDYYYPIYRAGAFLELNSEKHDMLKIQYNYGFEENKDSIHQALVQGYLAFPLFSTKSYARTGLMVTYPETVNPLLTIDYAFLELGMSINPSFTHSLAYIKNEVVYYLSPTEYFVEDFQEAYYRIYSNNPESKVKFNLSGGYSFSMGNHGYVAQANLFLKDVIVKKWIWFNDLTARNRGVYHQVSARTGLQMIRLAPILDVNVYAGYEYFLYRDYSSNGIVYGLGAQVDIPGNFTFNLDLDMRSVFNGNTEVYANVNLVHFLGARFEKEEPENGSDSGVTPN